MASPVRWMMFATTQKKSRREGHRVPFCHCSCASSSSDADGGSGNSACYDISSLLEMLASVNDPRDPRGRQHHLAFVLAVAVVATLAGARNYAEIARRARDMPPG